MQTPPNQPIQAIQPAVERDLLPESGGVWIQTTPLRLVLALLTGLALLALAAEAVLVLAGANFESENSRMIASWEVTDTALFDPIPGRYFFGGQDIRINRHRCRGDDFGPKRKGVERWIAIGDSTVFGYGVPETDTWPVALERILTRSLGRPVEVLNLGKIGFSTHGNLQDIRDWGDRLQPDGVIVGAGAWNDYQVLYMAPDLTEAEAVHRHPYRTLVETCNSSLRSSRLYQLYMGIRLEKEIQAIGASDAEARKSGRFSYDAVGAPRRVPPAQFEENLAAMCDWARERSIPILFTQPRITAATEEEFPILQRYVEGIDRTAERCGAVVVPTREAIESLRSHKREKEIWVDTVHLSSLGNRVVAQSVADSILAHSHTRPQE